MISTTLRTWNIQHNSYPSVFLYRNTPSGIFSITDVEAEIQEQLTPLERFTLQLADSMEQITRIEVSAASGISIELCEETLQDILSQGLLEYCDFERGQFQENLDKLLQELGEDWFTPYIQNLSKRKIIKQYRLSQEGKQAMKKNLKTVREARDLNIVMTGDPFYLFYDQIDLKPDGYETLEMNRNLVGRVLEQAVEHADHTGIKPISIGSNSVIDGKEVSSTQFWVSVEGNGSLEFNSAHFQAYLSSRVFDRWSNLHWNTEIQSFLPRANTIKDLVVAAISHTYMMVEDVILEGLELHEDQVTWVFQVDLEMQLLIFDVMPEPITQTRVEVKLKLPDIKWNVVVVLQLEPYDDLSDKSLKAARFHQNVSRKGFSLEEGYALWKQIMEDWGKPVKRQEYVEILETLVQYNCLIERLPKIDEVIVDVDDLLRKDRRGRQKWELNRIREIEYLLQQASIEKIRFVASESIYSKIDEEEMLKQWIEKGKVEIYPSEGEEDYPLLQAREHKCHYIGDKTINSGDGRKDYSRSIAYTVEKKRVQIPGVEPFYDWRMENLFQKMYDIYYE